MEHWTDFYNDECNLISDMMLTYTEPNGLPWKLCKGYEYLNSFKAYYRKNGRLTDKQLTQLKRLAPEVYRNVHKTLKIGE